MKQSDSRRSYVTGFFSDYLGVTAGKVNDTPVGILTFRPHVTSPQPVNLMISRAQIIRLREDIDALLARSEVLKDGDAPAVSLAEIEAIHECLG